MGQASSGLDSPQAIQDVESAEASRQPQPRLPAVLPAARTGLLGALVQFVVELTPNSEVVRGMIAMSAFGIARDSAVELWRLLVTWMAKRCWMTVRLEEKEAELLRIWLREQPEVQSSSDLSVYTRRGVDPTEQPYKYMFEPALATATRLRVTCPGGRRKWIWVSQGDKQAATVSFLGTNKKFLEVVFEEGRAIRKQKQERDLTVVQVYDYGGETGLHWLHPQEKVAKQPGRPISSVILPLHPEKQIDQAKALLEDATDFLESEQWYTLRGIPYRRGYLLHGVPGSGKSSLVMALAHELQLPIYMLSLSSAKMNDDKLNNMLQFGMHDPPSILLLEDIDILHSVVLHRSMANRADTDSDRGDKKDDDSEAHVSGRSKSRLTLSGLLNALDGPTATTGRLLFMTTNARERLDPALIRSGRIDYEIEFKAVQPEQAFRLFKHFYSDLSAPSSASGSSSCPQASGSVCTSTEDIPDLAQAFAEEVRKLSAAGPAFQVTAADIQSHLVKYKKAPLRAVRELRTHIHTTRPQEGIDSPDDDSASVSMVDCACGPDVSADRACGPDTPITASPEETASSADTESQKQAYDDNIKANPESMNGTSPQVAEQAHVAGSPERVGSEKEPRAGWKTSKTESFHAINDECELAD
mmetsp:Transcript_15121/g.34410  ORF Transcript_15121/g.34410 Transcript_15121/m.34410 type:complete len:643 (-) Transcript_15121:188-2116(-)